MKQVLQNLKSGETELADVPCPDVRAGHVLIRTRASLISPGTERMLLRFGKAGLVDKARQQPDKVRQVVDKMRTDGLLPTVEAVRAKLDQPIPLGYANAGVVLAVGRGVTTFKPGDRVASNGHHAEVVCVPHNLCARIPDAVGDEAASFTVLGAIALQGIRLAAPTLGEIFAVSGLGLIGLLCVQMLRAQGCRVLGIDFDPDRCALAKKMGAETVDLSQGADPLAAASALTGGRGIDGVIIAAATDSDTPVHQAAVMSRKRGRIILVGVVGLKLSRDDFYKKELSFQVSCAYGPGRYDPDYEDRGRDYPLPYVRWTAQHNFEAVLDLLAARAVDVDPLVSARHGLDEVERAYRQLFDDQSALGVVLRYPVAREKPDAAVMARTVRLSGEAGGPARHASQAPVVAFIGAGNYASRVLMPAFQQAGASLDTVVCQGGTSGVHVGRKFSFRQATTDVERVFAGSGAGRSNVVAIATRHDSHARYVLDALAAGKHVFCEKPLCLTSEELDAIEAVVSGGRAQAAHAHLHVMVGFNRRFAPHVKQMVQRLSSLSGPKCMVMTVNAGEIPADHWTQQPSEGGGRILGEACHFVDLLRYLAGAPIEQVSAVAMDTGGTVSEDNATLNLQFGDGSMGTVHYFANGHRSFPKEHLQVFCDGRVLALDNFRTLRGYGWSGLGRHVLLRQDKGNAACVSAFVEAVRAGRATPIPFDEIVNVTRACLQAVEQLRS